MEIDILIGSDLYWELVTGRVIWSTSGRTAIETRVGLVLSKQIEELETMVNFTLSSTHALRIDCYPLDQTLDDQLKQFWELEALGISTDEPSIYEKFIQQIKFTGGRYQVGKEHHPPLLTNLNSATNDSTVY